MSRCDFSRPARNSAAAEAGSDRMTSMRLGTSPLNGGLSRHGNVSAIPEICGGLRSPCYGGHDQTPPEGLKGHGRGVDQARRRRQSGKALNRKALNRRADRPVLLRCAGRPAEAIPAPFAGRWRALADHAPRSPFPNTLRRNADTPRTFPCGSSPRAHVVYLNAIATPMFRPREGRSATALTDRPLPISVWVPMGMESPETARNG
jgi:hypothetical protein